MKIGLMVQLHAQHIIMDGFPLDNIKHTNDIFRLIRYRITMHEVFMAADQFQNPSLFSGAAKALEGDGADMAGKLFVKGPT